MSTLSQETFWLQTDGWQHFHGLVHGFSSHLQNREAALAKLGVSNLLLHTLKQVHGDRIIAITNQSSLNAKTEADGLISAQPGVLLGIATADCVPVLMVEPYKRVVAALHAGWRGTLKGIAHQAIKLLVSEWKVDLKNLYVALGPSIGGCCYEVGPEVGESIVSRWNIRSASAWRPHAGKGFLDLREINALQMVEAGAPQIQIALTGPCTFCHSSFASYRRDGVAAGRQLSIIGWLDI
jgi:YfiH family protein